MDLFNTKFGKLNEIMSQPEFKVETNGKGYLSLAYYIPNQPPNRFNIDKAKYQGNARIWNSKNNNYDVYVILEGNSRIRVASVCEQMAILIVEIIETELTKTDK
jgi:hypothetical protein